MNFRNYERRTYLNIIIKGRENLIGKKKANHILLGTFYCIKSKEEVNYAFQKKKKKLKFWIIDVLVLKTKAFKL